MKISSVIGSVGQVADGGSSSAGAARTPAPQTGTQTDQVALSPLSTRLQEIGASVSSTSTPVDSQRVSQIKQAIAEGRFSINPDRIASGLLNDVRKMLSAQG